MMWMYYAQAARQLYVRHSKFGASGNCYLAPVATAVCQWQLLCGIIWRQWQLLCGMISVTQSDQVPNAPYPQSAPLP